MSYDERTVEQVWEHGRVIPETDPTEWRKDECGAWIRREHYGSDKSEFGWRIVDVAPGESQSVENLRPLHRDNGFDPAGHRPHCHVTADSAGRSNKRGG